MKKPLFVRIALFAAALSVAAAQVGHADSRNADVRSENRGSFLLKGVMQLDYSQYDKFFNGVDVDDDSIGDGDGSDIFFRRVRVGFNGQREDWKYKFEYEFEDGDNGEFTDAYLAYTGLEGVTLTFGKSKIPFGLDELTSSRDIIAIERNIVNQAMAPGRHNGIKISGHGKNFGYSIGVFEENKDDSGHIEPTLAGRFTWTPILNDAMTLHLGASFLQSAHKAGVVTTSPTHTAHDDDAQTLSVRPVRDGDDLARKLVSGEFAYDGYDKLGLELGFVYGPWHARMEYIEANYDKQSGADGDSDASFDGFSMLGSYMLTGESRPYDVRSGKFGGIKPDNPQLGAWEVFLRWSELDMKTDIHGDGVDLSSMTYGLNWYPNDNMRLMFNFIDTEDDNATPGAPGDGDALAVRLQYAF